MSLDQSNCPSSLRLFISDEDLLALANDDVGFWCRYVGLTLSDSKRGGGAARCCKRKRAAPVRPPLRMRRLSETRNIALPPCTSPDGAPPSRSTIFFCDSPESCSTLSSLLPSLPPSPVRPAFLSAFATLNTADDPSHDLMGLDGAFPSSATHGLLRTGEVAKSRRWLLKQLPEHVVVEHVHYRLASWVENQKGRKAKGREGQA
ncbi:hypothetical protein JCM10207_003830 [Rhodosporidiobolus poonsookiae]